MGCAASGRSGSIRTRDLAADQNACGGHDLHDPRPTGVSWAAGSCRLPVLMGGWVLQRADVSVAQRIEHVLDL